MSHLPQIVQTIAKKILSKDSSQEQHQDISRNDAQPNLQQQTKIQELKQVESDKNIGRIPRQSIVVNQQFTSQSQFNTLTHDQNNKITNAALNNFIKTQQHKLKLLYPNFQQSQIACVARQIWNKLSQSQKNQHYHRQQRNAIRQYSERIFQAERNTNLILEKKRKLMIGVQIGKQKSEQNYQGQCKVIENQPNTEKKVHTLLKQEDKTINQQQPNNTQLYTNQPKLDNCSSSQQNSSSSDNLSNPSNTVSTALGPNQEKNNQKPIQSLEKFILLQCQDIQINQENVQKLSKALSQYIQAQTHTIQQPQSQRETQTKITTSILNQKQSINESVFIIQHIQSQTGNNNSDQIEKQNQQKDSNIDKQEKIVTNYKATIGQVIQIPQVNEQAQVSVSDNNSINKNSEQKQQDKSKAIEQLIQTQTKLELQDPFAISPQQK